MWRLNVFSVFIHCIKRVTGQGWLSELYQRSVRYAEWSVARCCIMLSKCMEPLFFLPPSSPFSFLLPPPVSFPFIHPGKWHTTTSLVSDAQHHGAFWPLLSSSCALDSPSISSSKVHLWCDHSGLPPLLLFYFWPWQQQSSLNSILFSPFAPQWSIFHTVVATLFLRESEHITQLLTISSGFPSPLSIQVYCCGRWVPVCSGPATSPVSVPMQFFSLTGSWAHWSHCQWLQGRWKKPDAQAKAPPRRCDLCDVLEKANYRGGKQIRGCQGLGRDWP